MSYTNKTSILVPEQLPEFIRGDISYSTFVTFIKAYYEWMELSNTANSLSTTALTTTANSYNQGTVYASKNLPSYYDIDTTLNDFLDFYREEFLAFFPADSVVDKRKLIKTAKELYKTKGTPASYEFLFRVLYNSDVEIFNAKDYVFKASDGKWIIPKSINISSTDPIWKQTIGRKIIGKTSTGVATIDSVIIHPTFIDVYGDSQIGYTEVFVTDVGRNFISDEIITVCDSFNIPIIFPDYVQDYADFYINPTSDGTLTSLILGIIQSISVDPAYPGTGYEVGSPVAFVGGIDPNLGAAAAQGANEIIRAQASVSKVSQSPVQSVSVTYGGHGYLTGPRVDITSSIGGNGATAFIGSVDTNVYYLPYMNLDTVYNFANTYQASTGLTNSPPIGNAYYVFANTIANVANVYTVNVNSRLVDSLFFGNIATYGVSTITMVSGGQGYEQPTTFANAYGTYTAADGTTAYISGLGILSPIKIVSPGIFYANGDNIVFSGGGGTGAFAYVNVAPVTGAIVSVTYTTDPTGNVVAPLGGLGYSSPPRLSITSTSPGHANAVLSVGIVGADAILQPSTGVSGQVLEITLLNKGSGYVSKPEGSLRVSDVAYSGYYGSSLKYTDYDVVVQTVTGARPKSLSDSANITFYAPTVYQEYALFPILRIVDYVGTINTSSNLMIYTAKSAFKANVVINTNASAYYGPKYINGVNQYGSGTAKTIVGFSQGIQLGGATSAGFYLNSDGQPSSYSVLENNDYNTFTYFLKVEKALKEYKDTALKFLHPAGLHYVAKNMLKSATYLNPTFVSEEQYNSRLITSLGTFTANSVPNSNTITITVPYSTSNVQNVIPTNSYVSIIPPTGLPFTAQVLNVANSSSGTNYKYDITLDDTWINSVSNVAYGTVSSTNQINITNTTSAWNIATGQRFVSSFASFFNINDNITFDTGLYANAGIITSVTGTSITVSGNLVINTSGVITLTRNISTSNIYYSGPVTPIVILELITENGNTIITESGSTLLIG